jgi:hypothetical protein
VCMEGIWQGKVVREMEADRKRAMFVKAVERDGVAVTGAKNCTRRNGCQSSWKSPHGLPVCGLPMP